MNIKCFSDLEKWMQGIVDQVKVATGTSGPVCLHLSKWHHRNGDSDTSGSIWVDERNEHYGFKNYRELCKVIEDLELARHGGLLYRKF